MLLRWFFPLMVALIAVGVLCPPKWTDFNHEDSAVVVAVAIYTLAKLLGILIAVRFVVSMFTSNPQN